jgi:hypothetical protein
MFGGRDRRDSDLLSPDYDRDSRYLNIGQVERGSTGSERIGTGSGGDYPLEPHLQRAASRPLRDELKDRSEETSSRSSERQDQEEDEKNIEMRPQRPLPQQLAYPVELSFKDVSYTVKVKRNQKKAVLDKVSGFAKPGEVLAIMGPSGSGKCKCFIPCGFLTLYCSYAFECTCWENSSRC